MTTHIFISSLRACIPARPAVHGRTQLVMPVIAHGVGWIMCCLPICPRCVERWEADRAVWCLHGLLFLHYWSGWGLMIRRLRCKANGLKHRWGPRNSGRGWLFGLGICFLLFHLVLVWKKIFISSHIRLPHSLEHHTYPSVWHICTYMCNNAIIIFI